MNSRECVKHTFLHYEEITILYHVKMLREDALQLSRVFDLNLSQFEGGFMKREEKNKQMKRRIMDNAMAEFAKQGYGASSVNTICAAQNISKGIIYHYFKTKDDLYLACVEECFKLLTEHMKENISAGQNPVEKQLQDYFEIRMDFFQKHPVYQPIFCEAVISLPVHLKAEIQMRKQVFDTLNVSILEEILELLPLRPDIKKEEVVEIFREFQDFINAKYQIAHISTQEFQMREESCRRALNILLYGVIDR